MCIYGTGSFNIGYFSLIQAFLTYIWQTPRTVSIIMKRKEKKKPSCCLITYFHRCSVEKCSHIVYATRSVISGRLRSTTARI